MSEQDPHDGEPTKEIDKNLFIRLMEAQLALAGWQAEVQGLRKQIEDALGDAFAGTVDGKKVVTYRWKDSYNTTNLRKDYPDLTDQFVEFVTKRQFAMAKFADQHPDLAKRYQTREFRLT